MVVPLANLTLEISVVILYNAIVKTLEISVVILYQPYSFDVGNSVVILHCIGLILNSFAFLRQKNQSTFFNLEIF